MEYKGGALCLIERNNKILMLRTIAKGIEYYQIPGGNIDKGKTPEQAALIKLQDECNVSGKVIRKLSECLIPPYEDEICYTFHVDIGEQTPTLGKNPELPDDKQKIKELLWVSLDEVRERDRVFLWTSGLFNLPQFFDEFWSWGDEISYPGK